MRFGLASARLAAVAGAITVGTGVAFGQRAVQPLPPPAGQTPVFKATTNFVRTDVIVRDNQGRFVPGLTAADFTVYEDGVRQTIGTFRPFIGGRDMGPAMTPPARSGEGVVLPNRAVPDTSGRIFIIFIDDLSIQGKHTIHARRILDLIKEIIHDEDRIAIVSSGYSSIAVNLLHDYGLRQLDLAKHKTMGAGMDSAQILAAAPTSQGPAGLRYMAHVAFRTANDILDRLASEPGVRKSFIFISEGYDYAPYQESLLRIEQERYGLASGGDAGSAFTNPFRKPGTEFADADLVADIAELIRNANRANVAFYPLDPRGLTVGPDINERISMTEYRNQVAASTGSLRAIAANTGGFCACDTNDFKGALARIDNETSDYYMIGYNSTNTDARKPRRLLRIEVMKAGLTLTYNREYTFRK